MGGSCKDWLFIFEDNISTHDVASLKSLSAYDMDEDDFDGELYRVGLRLSEVYDEISEQRNRKDTLNSQRGLNVPKKMEVTRDHDEVFEDIRDTDATKSSIRFSNDEHHKRKVSIDFHKRKCSGCHQNASSKKTNLTNSCESSKLSENKHFDDRYLSQSLPPDDWAERQSFERPPSSAHYEMGNTGTETSYFNQYSSNSKSEPALHEANPYKRKNIGSYNELLHPHKGVKEEPRPNTMNSTEDSGFIEIERIDSRIDNFLNNLQVGSISQQSLQVPDTSQQSMRNVSPPFGRHREISQNRSSNSRSRHSSTSTEQSRRPGNYYDGRIQSLRNFLQADDALADQSSSSVMDQSQQAMNESASSNDSEANISLKNSPKKANTPRSYVRVKPVSENIYVNPSRKINYRNDESETEANRSKTSNFRRFEQPTNNHRRSHSGDFLATRNSLDMPERYRVYRSHESLVDAQTDNLRESFPLEHLHDDMKEIKDLIIEMRQSLALNPNENPRESSINEMKFTPPRMHPKTRGRHRDRVADKVNRSQSKRTHQIKDTYSECSDDDFESQNYSRVDNSIDQHDRRSRKEKPENLQNNHMEVLRRLETKLDLVAEEMRDYRINNTIDINNNANTTNSDFLENSNMDNNNVLQNIANRIDNLSSVMKEQNTMESTQDESESLRGKLIKRIENKIEEIDSQVKYKENTKETSTHSPIYHSNPCPICGGINTHRHNGYLHAGLDWNSNDVTYEGRQRFGQALHNTTIDRLNDSSYFNKRMKQRSSPNPIFEATKRSDHFYYNEDQQRPPNHMTQRSPQNIFHHYHSIHHSTPYPKKQQNTPPRLVHVEDSDNRRGVIDYQQPVYNEMVERSLANASIAAFNMESISKKMLKTIASDLLNSGPSEY